MSFKSPNRTFLKRYGWKQIEGKNHWYHPQYPNKLFLIDEAITLQRAAIGKKPLPWIDDEKEGDLFDDLDN